MVRIYALSNTYTYTCIRVCICLRACVLLYAFACLCVCICILLSILLNNDILSMHFLFVFLLLPYLVGIFVGYKEQYS